MPRRTTPTITEVMHDYLDTLRAASYAESTLEDKKKILRAFARVNNNIMVGSVTEGHVTKYLNTVVSQRGFSQGGGKRSTKMRYRGLLRGFFEYCEKEKLIDSAIRVVPKTTGLAQGEGRGTQAWQMTKTETRRLIESLEDPLLRAMVVVALNTALRVHSVCLLRIKDVLLDQDKIMVCATKTNTYDVFPMTPRLKMELAEYLRWYERELGRKPSREDYLFPHRSQPFFTKGGKPSQRSQELDPARPQSPHHSKIERAFRAAGYTLNEREGWHTLRRSAARQYYDDLVKKGVMNAMVLTQALLMHKQITTTQEYLGLTPEKVQRDKYLAEMDFLEESDPAVQAEEAGGNVVKFARRRKTG